MIPIVDKLYYIEASSTPLSAESFIIQYPDRYYLFDVGNSESSLTELSSLKKPLIAIISHFHIDHLGNASKLNFKDVYGSKLSLRHLGYGHLVTEKIKLNDEIEIGLIPSSHEKGCCYLKYKDILLSGDALYPANHGYVKSRLMETILFLKQLDFAYVINSHQAPKMTSKEETINNLMKIYRSL